MSNIQVTFDPTLWTAGSGSGTAQGCNGYNASTIFLDQDGTTAWAFEYQGGGFGRFTITTGSIVHQDVAFGGGTGKHFNGIEGVNTVFLQDNSNHYFLMTNDLMLYKFHIASGGTTGTVLNGYEVVDGFYDLTTLPLYIETSLVVRDALIWFYGGAQYLAILSHYSLYIFDADTFTYMGVFNLGGSGGSDYSFVQMFVDKNNVLWMFANVIDNYGYLYSFSWDAVVDGFTSGSPAVQGPDFISLSWISTITNRSSVTAVGYVPNFVSSHSQNSSGGALFFNQVTNTCDVALVDLAHSAVAYDINNNPYQIQDNLVFSQGRTAYSAAHSGTRNGLFMLEGSTGSSFQLGGVLRVIDPTTLTPLYAYDVTSAINNDSTLTSCPYQASATGQYAIISSISENSGNVLSLTTSANNLSTSSYLQFLNAVASSSWLNSVGPTSIQVTGFEFQGSPVPNTLIPVCSDATSHGAYGPDYQVQFLPSYPPTLAYASAQMTQSLYDFQWSSTLSRVLLTYQGQINNGSPVYILPTVAGQTTVTSLTVIPNPSIANTNTMVTATVTGTSSGHPISGTVSFYDGSTLLGVVNIDNTGTAVLNTMFSTGAHSLSARFSGGS